MCGSDIVSVEIMVFWRFIGVLCHVILVPRECAACTGLCDAYLRFLLAILSSLARSFT